MNSDPSVSPRRGETAPLLHFERALWARGLLHIAGVDEAGRGPLAGPVVAAAVMCVPDFVIPGVDDSKKLSAGVREELYERIMQEAPGVGVGIVSNEEIDEMNILNATFKAMGMALDALRVAPDHVLIDGNRFCPADREQGGRRPLAFTTIVRGDEKSFSIAAASIVAKVTRDRIMREYDLQFPGYGFARHKGYGTKEHIEAIGRLGRCPLHRQSFHLRSQLELEWSA